jgi:hypothetical protein
MSTRSWTASTTKRPNPSKTKRARRCGPTTRAHYKQTLLFMETIRLMPRVIIDPSIRQEIRASMVGLSNSRARAEALRWAGFLNVDISRVYAVTKDIRPPRKRRSDSGKRRADLKTHAGIAFATTQVVGANLDPKRAMEMARANGFETPISVGSYRRQLNEAGLSRAQRRSKVVVYRSFEAEAPGVMFQCDVSGLKTRWLDPSTRRVLHVHAGDVNANHPNRKSNRVPLWKFSVKDDHSRFLFTRFFAAERETSCLIVDLLLEAFRTMGVPLAMYTDNASVFKSCLMKRAVSILDRAFASHGGFKWQFHEPYNPNAGGKIESSHQLVEQFERQIGIGDVPTLDELNQYAVNFCDLYNATQHRTTKIKPYIRFRAGHGVMRIAPDPILNDAFKAKELEVKVNGDVTISIDAKRWQLPSSPRIAASLNGAKEINNPFIDLAVLGRKISIVWPIESDWFVAIVRDSEFEIAKVEAVADAAYEHKSVAEPTGVSNTKHFKELASQQAQAVRKGEKKIIRPGIEVPFEIAAEDRAAVMPRREVNPSLAEWANTTPGIAAAIGDQMFSYFVAAELLQQEETLSNPLTLPEKHWLETLFNGRDQIAESELRAAVTARSEWPILAEVKSA